MLRDCMNRSRRRARPARSWIVSVGLLVVFFAPLHVWAGSGPLHILLTNDDGYDSPGIQAMGAALEAAGHRVTIVARLTEQSGKGGSLNTNVGSFVDVIEQSPGVWSVDSTPTDAVRAALGAVLVDDPPDLLVSGSNFGQNLGQTGSTASGTVNAALQGLFSGLPAIAVSVGIDIREARDTPIPFPSTFAAFEPAGEFTVRLIERLQRSAPRGELLPDRTMLNVNIPVPYEAIRGVQFVRLASRSSLEFVWQDVRGVIPSGGGPVLINIDFATEPDPVPRNDTDAFREGFITVTAMDGDMTAGLLRQILTQLRLHDIAP